jgi:hypothetical protein
LVSLWLNAQFAQFLRQPLGALAFLLRTLMLLLGSRTLLLTQ